MGEVLEQMADLETSAYLRIFGRQDGEPLGRSGHRIYVDMKYGDKTIIRHNGSTMPKVKSL